MKLLVDAGNSRLKWAWLDAVGLAGTGALAHGGRAGPEAVAAMLDGRRPAAVAMASVAAPAVTDALLEAFAAAGLPVERAVTGVAFEGLRNGYARPEQMGVDRWLALVAAWSRLRRAACVVDAGTALTLDVVDDGGRHLGGYIVPGSALMRRALIGGTGRIGESAGLAVPAAGPTAWGLDTESCMALGAGRALACLVEDSVKALAARSASPPALVVTGGDAGGLLAGLSSPAEHRPHLVLEGLALVGAGGGATASGRRP